MAQRIVITYQCPRCRIDVARHFGLITKRVIECPGCGAIVHLETGALQQNWGYNFGWIGGLLTWFCLGFLVLADPQFAASVGGKTMRADTPQNRLVLAGCMAVPALFVALLAGGLGMLCATFVGSLPSAETSSPTPSTLPTPSAAPPDPLQRGCLIRLFFLLFWPIFFFFGTVFAFALVIVAVERSEGVKNQSHEALMQSLIGWIFLIAFMLFLAGVVGVMPWTGARKKKKGAAPEGPTLIVPPTGPRDWGR